MSDSYQERENLNFSIAILAKENAERKAENIELKEVVASIASRLARFEKYNKGEK